MGLVGMLAGGMLGIGGAMAGVIFGILCIMFDVVMLAAIGGANLSRWTRIARPLSW